MTPTRLSPRPRAVVAGIVALVVLVLGAATLSGCTSDGDPAAAKTSVAQSSFPGGGVLAAGSARGGTLRAVAGSVDSLDPGRSYLPWVWNFMRLYNRTLVTYGQSKTGGAPPVVPDLATDTGQVSADGKTWTFTLKPGLTFDDGTPITSKTVKYGIERSFAVDTVTGGPTYLINLLDDPNAPYEGPYTDPSADKLGLASIGTPDDATITFTLNRPYADFRYLLTMPDSAPVPQARDTGQDYGAKPASSGPYTVAAIDPVTGVRLVRNERWSASTDTVRTALPDQIDVRTGLSQLDRDQEVLSGAADVDLTSSGVSERTADRVAGSSAVARRAVVVASGRVRLLAIPTFVAPFTDAGCRQAVAAVVSRPAVVQTLGGPAAAVALRDLWPTSMPGYRAGFTEPPPRDPAAFATCFPGGTTLNLAAPNVPADLRVATALVQSLTKAGVKVSIKGSDPATYYGGTLGDDDAVKAANLGLLSIRWSADYPGMSSFLARLVDSRAAYNAGSNFVGLSDPDLDAALDTAVATPPPDAQALWVGLSQRVSGTYTYVPLVEERVTLLAGSRLANVRVNGAYHGFDVVTLGVARG